MNTISQTYTWTDSIFCLRLHDVLRENPADVPNPVPVRLILEHSKFEASSAPSRDALGRYYLPLAAFNRSLFSFRGPLDDLHTPDLRPFNIHGIHHRQPSSSVLTVSLLPFLPILFFACIPRSSCDALPQQALISSCDNGSRHSL